MNLRWVVVESTAASLQAKDFHDGVPQRSRLEYMNEAEDMVNSLSNVELLEIIGEALHVARIGGAP